MKAHIFGAALICAAAAIPAFFPRAAAAKPEKKAPPITLMTVNLDGPDNMDLDAPHGQLVIDLTKKQNQLTYSSMSVYPPKVDSFKPEELERFDRALAKARAQILVANVSVGEFLETDDFITITSIAGGKTFQFSADYEDQEFAPKKYDSVRKLVALVKAIMARIDPSMAAWGPQPKTRTPGAAGVITPIGR